MYLSKVIWRGTGGGPPPIPPTAVVSTFNCPPAVAVGDAVYVLPGPPLTVDKAFMGLVGQTTEAVGIVIAKPSPVTCDVALYGMAAVPFPVVQGSIYYTSNLVPGGITTVAPAAAGEKQQRIGVAASGGVLVVNPTLASVKL
jgi:hypothetical protein